MANTYKSREEAINQIEKMFDSPTSRERLLTNLKSDLYKNSDIEFILEAFDGNTNHVIKEEEEEEEYVTITLEGDLFDKVKKSELKKWMDDFFSKKLKNNPKKYSDKLWNQLKEYEVHIDGESFCLPYYDEELSNKWF